MKSACGFKGTNKEDALVEFATAGMDENLFVSKYLLKLPSKQKPEQLIIDELRNVEVKVSV